MQDGIYANFKTSKGNILVKLTTVKLSDYILARRTQVVEPSQQPEAKISNIKWPE
jgi:hypothetical protein